MNATDDTTALNTYMNTIAELALATYNLAYRSYIATDAPDAPEAKNTMVAAYMVCQALGMPGF